MISAPQRHLSLKRMPFGKQSTRDGDDFICGVERTGSEERVCRIQLCLEGFINDVSMLRARRGGACFVVVSGGCRCAGRSRLVYSLKVHTLSTFISTAFVF
jgi:hypothetical protein